MENGDQCVTPGQRLGHIDDFEAGEGTFQRGQHIYASVVGFKDVVMGEENQKPVINVTVHRYKY